MSIVDLGEQCEHLLEEIENNCRRAATIRNQIERLRLEKQTFPSTVSTVSYSSFPKEEIDEEKDAFLDEVDYYLSDYLLLDSSFTREDLLSILPKKSNYHYQDIIFRLQAESIREIKEIDEILLESDEITKDELQEYRELLDTEQRKISILKECLMDKDSSVDEEENNQIILVPTTYGNIRIIDELEHIPRDYYSNFYELIQSIIDGSFKGVKRFTNNRYLNGISEVKAFKIRVAFTRIGQNSYALITAFMKKSDNEKIYQESLQNKISEYRKMEKDLKKSLSNKEFMKTNEKNVSELFELLTGEKENEKGRSL